VVLFAKDAGERALCEFPVPSADLDVRGDVLVDTPAFPGAFRWPGAHDAVDHDPAHPGDYRVADKLP
jgi:hypothetical protein